MMKIIYSVLVLIIFASLSHQTILSRSLKRCRRATTSSCVLTPEVTEGPYYWNTSLMRQNISEDRGGVRFRLQVVVMDINTCSPLANAAVTLWHCDAFGIYSHYIQASQNVQNPQNDNQTFLRGIQLTNTSGVATFDTIYPGWYNGRATHMHVKVHLGGTYLTASSYYSGASYVHTGQLFFNDTLSDLVALQSPYSTHSGSRMLNSADNIYATTGAYTLMNIQYVNSASGMSSGLITSVTLGVTSTSSSSSSTTKAASTSSSSSITTTKQSSTIKTAATTKQTSTTKAPTTTTTKKASTTTKSQSNQNQPGNNNNGGRPNSQG